MSNRQLNKEVKKLYKRTIWKKMTGHLLNAEIKPTFLNLYYQDKGLERMNRDSILMMLRMNLRYGFTPNFGTEINETKLLKI